MGFLHYLRETVEPGSSAKWLRPPQVQHILNYKACHSAIRYVVPQDPRVEYFWLSLAPRLHDIYRKNSVMSTDSCCCTEAVGF